MPNRRVVEIGVKIVEIPTECTYHTWEDVKAAAGDTESFFLLADSELTNQYRLVPWWAVLASPVTGEDNYLDSNRRTVTRPKDVVPGSALQYLPDWPDGMSSLYVRYQEAPGHASVYLSDIILERTFSGHNFYQFVSAAAGMDEDFLAFAGRCTLLDSVHEAVLYPHNNSGRDLNPYVTFSTVAETATVLPDGPADPGRFPQTTVLGSLTPTYNSMTETLTHGPIGYAQYGCEGAYLFTPASNRGCGVGEKLLLKALQDGHRTFLVKNDIPGVAKSLPWMMKRGAKVRGVTADGEFIVTTIRVGGVW